MERQQKINVDQAAEYTMTTKQNIYKAIRDKRLKFVKLPVERVDMGIPRRKWKIYTTYEWVDDWVNNLRNKIS